MATVISVLQETRRLVSGGWVQKSFECYRPGQPTCYCLVGAVQEATIYCVVFYEPTLQALRNQLPDGRGSTYYSLLTYNDTPGRTQLEVLHLIDRTIAAETLASSG